MFLTAKTANRMNRRAGFERRKLARISADRRRAGLGLAGSLVGTVVSAIVAILYVLS